MKTFMIECQKAHIGWKETNYENEITTTFVEYDSLEDLLIGEEYSDWDADENSPFIRILAALDKEGGFMTTGAGENAYWHDPEPCDSYLTYGYYITIRELSADEVNAVKNEKMKWVDDNQKKWELLFDKFPNLNQLPLLLEHLKTNYEFPKKLL